MSRGYDGPEIGDFVTPVLTGHATQIEIRSQTGTVALLFTTSIGKKPGPTDSTPKLVNAATKTVHRCPAKNGSGNSFRSESEPSIRTRAGSTHCGIPRFTHWEKWTSSASWPNKT